MKPYKIIKFQNKKDWEFYLKLANSKTLENSHNFCNIFNSYFKDTEPEIFWFEKNNSTCFYAYLKSKSLIGNYFHIHSPYCYGGFLSNDDSEMFFSLFRKNFVEYCNEEKILTEFVRLNPINFVKKEYYKNYFDQFKLHSNTFYVNNSKKYQITRAYAKRLIKKCKKRINLNFTFDDQKNFNQFFDMYNFNMKSKKVSNFLNFNKSFFYLIEKFLKKNFYFPTISLGNKIIAGAIFLKNENFLDLYLAASYPEAKINDGCNHYLFDAFLTQVNLYKKNIRYVHLGGGSTSLCFFKKNFTTDQTNYYTIKNIINKPLYANIIKKKIDQNIYDNFFPDQKFYNYLPK